MLSKAILHDALDCRFCKLYGNRSFREKIKDGLWFMDTQKQYDWQRCRGCGRITREDLVGVEQICGIVWLIFYMVIFGLYLVFHLKIVCMLQLLSSVSLQAR